jgi:uncharacterized phage protein (TIGR02220 family)
VNDRYRKVTLRMWGDEKFRQLSVPRPNGQTLWIYLLTGPHTGPIPGLAVVGEAGLAEALGWPLKAFRAAFSEITAQGMAEADWSARVVFLPKAIDHNPPESPNVVRAWPRYMAEIPECLLKFKAAAILKASLEAKGKAWAEAYEEAWPKASGKASPHPLANQEQEQEQEQEKSRAGRTPLTPQGGNVDGAPAQAVLWLEALNEIGALQFKATATQLRPIQARIAEGFTVEEARLVLTAKVREWVGSDMAKYLRPATLFGAKFDGYLQAAVNGSGNGTRPSRHTIGDAWAGREGSEVSS